VECGRNGKRDLFRKIAGGGFSADAEVAIGEMISVENSGQGLVFLLAVGRQLSVLRC
jgi:hypothetical protein